VTRCAMTPRLKKFRCEDTSRNHQTRCAIHHASRAAPAPRRGRGRRRKRTRGGLQRSIAGLRRLDRNHSSKPPGSDRGTVVSGEPASHPAVHRGSEIKLNVFGGLRDWANSPLTPR
jgi:hypothetical protein